MDGEYEALSRLIFGLGSGFEDAAVGSGLTREAARELHAKLSPSLFELLFVEAMPIRDAVDLARFLVETTIGFVKFSVARPPPQVRERGSLFRAAAIARPSCSLASPMSWLTCVSTICLPRSGSTIGREPLSKNARGQLLALKSRLM